MLMWKSEENSNEKNSKLYQNFFRESSIPDRRDSLHPPWIRRKSQRSP
jgi:hypothetical protein